MRRSAKENAELITDPTEKAGYVINDDEGIRYFEVDYNKETNQ